MASSGAVLLAAAALTASKHAIVMSVGIDCLGASRWDSTYRLTAMPLDEPVVLEGAAALTEAASAA